MTDHQSLNPRPGERQPDEGDTSQVPDGANDAVEWMNDPGIGDDERRSRIDAVESAERGRSDKRRTVTDAVAKARRELS